MNWSTDKAGEAMTTTLSKITWLLVGVGILTTINYRTAMRWYTNAGKEC